MVKATQVVVVVVIQLGLDRDWLVKVVLTSDDSWLFASVFVLITDGVLVLVLPGLGVVSAVEYDLVVEASVGSWLELTSVQVVCKVDVSVSF